jgi:hypothetical protein
MTTHPDAFALPHSDLNAFLFADVGTELNGSPLTILSILARLGEDPWAEAARLAKLPKGEAFDRLIQIMSKMPLGPQAVRNVGATVSHVIRLLPEPTRNPVQAINGAVASAARPRWVPIALLCVSLAFGLIGMLMMIQPAPPTMTVPAEQTAVQSSPDKLN